MHSKIQLQKLPKAAKQVVKYVNMRKNDHGKYCFITM